MNMHTRALLLCSYPQQHTHASQAALVHRSPIKSAQHQLCSNLGVREALGSLEHPQ